jgi:hypothetical protein
MLRMGQGQGGAWPRTIPTKNEGLRSSRALAALKELVFTYVDPA